MAFWIIAALAAGIALDRVVIWDKERAVTRERHYHIGTIGNLEKELQITKMDIYAMRRENGENVDARDFVYDNPHFEEDFIKYGRAKTTIHRKPVRRSA